MKMLCSRRALGSHLSSVRFLFGGAAAADDEKSNRFILILIPVWKKIRFDAGRAGYIKISTESNVASFGRRKRQGGALQ